MKKIIILLLTLLAFATSYSQKYTKITAYDSEGKQHDGYLWYADDSTLVISKNNFVDDLKAINYDNINRITLNGEKKRTFFKGCIYGTTASTVFFFALTTPYSESNGSAIISDMAVFALLTTFLSVPIGVITGFASGMPAQNKIDYNTYKKKHNFNIIVPYLKEKSFIETVDIKDYPTIPTNINSDYVQTHIPKERWHPLKENSIAFYTGLDQSKYPFAFRIAENLQNTGFKIDRFKSRQSGFIIACKVKIFSELDIFIKRTYKYAYLYAEGRSLGQPNAFPLFASNYCYINKDIMMGVKYNFYKINRMFLNRRNIYLSAALSSRKIEYNLNSFIINGISIGSGIEYYLKRNLSLFAETNLDIYSNKSIKERTVTFMNIETSNFNSITFDEYKLNLTSANLILGFQFHFAW